MWLVIFGLHDWKRDSLSKAFYGFSSLLEWRGRVIGRIGF
jgi:hypothetical protein